MGGSLVTYIGQYALPEILDYLCQPKTRLRYWHEFCIKLEGPQFARLNNPVIVVRWKHLLWFVKGEKPQLPLDDNFIIWLSDFGANALVRFNPADQTFEVFTLPSSEANVRQILGRPGEVWGAESGADKLVVITTSSN